MSEFFSRNNRPYCSCCPVGSSVSTDFAQTVDSEGNISIIETGKHDINEFIQASKEETLISNILQRYCNGDVNALNRKQGVFIDTTVMPSSLRQMQDNYNKIENLFNKLSDDVKQKFGNNVNDFISKVGSMDFESLKAAFSLNKSEVNNENDKDGATSE